MNCEHILSNGNRCKSKISKLNIQIDDKSYCTRHYNIFSNNNISKKEPKLASKSISKKITDNDIFSNNSISKKEPKLASKSISKKITENDISSILISDTKKNCENTKHLEKIILSILTECKISVNEFIFIGSGSFNSVYKIDISGKKYALKFQLLNKEEKNVLYYEYQILRKLKSDIILCLSEEKQSMYYKTNKYAFLITELMYETLSERKKLNNYTTENIKYIGNQLIDIIKHIHQNRYLYIDLKPDNIMFINKNEFKIKVIDYNSCNLYINLKSEFYDNEILKTPIGNYYYSSININKSYSGVRIDDIESIFWVILYLLDNQIIQNMKKVNDLNDLIEFKNNFINTRHNNKFIDGYIEELKKYDTNNKLPDYNKFIEIINMLE